MYIFKHLKYLVKFEDIKLFSINDLVGFSAREFVNVEFTNNELDHGNRYSVCIHAPETQIQRETWIETIAEINSCSDGIVVDLTPPVAGRLWIGHSPGIQYQVRV